MSKLLMTSGYNFEGHKISEYLGVFSGECALGTGFLSSLGAGFADFFGTNSTMYSEKLKKAKDFAVDQLKSQVIERGGDAIIGLDIDYVSFSADIMGVIASGTAVKFEDSLPIEEESDKKYTISVFNSTAEFRPSFLCASPSAYGESALSLGLFHLKECTVSAVLADIVFVDIFQRETVLNDVSFIGFKDENTRNLLSDPVTCDLSPDIFRLVSSIKLTIKRYVTKDGLVIVPNDEITYTSVEDVHEDVEDLATELLKKASSLNSAKEIYDYVVEYNETHSDSIDPELINILDKQKSFERLYGNHKEGTIKEIQKYFSRCKEG